MTQRRVQPVGIWRSGENDSRGSGCAVGYLTSLMVLKMNGGRRHVACVVNAKRKKKNKKEEIGGKMER